MKTITLAKLESITPVEMNRSTLKPDGGEKRQREEDKSGLQVSPRGLNMHCYRSLQASIKRIFAGQIIQNPQKFLEKTY